MGDCMARRLLMETHGAHCLAYGINRDTICPPLFVSLRAWYFTMLLVFDFDQRRCLLPSESFPGWLYVYRDAQPLGR